MYINEIKKYCIMYIKEHKKNEKRKNQLVRQHQDIN